MMNSVRIVLQLPEFGRIGVWLLFELHLVYPTNNFRRCPLPSLCIQYSFTQ